MTSLNLPEDLLAAIGTDKIEFSFFAKRKTTLDSQASSINFGIVWTLFVCIIFGSMFLQGIENAQKKMDAAVIMVFFLVIGLGLILNGIYPLLQKGGYFVGTKKSLIHYNNGILSTYEWELFSENFNVNLNRGDIILEFRTENSIQLESGVKIYFPKSITISGITDTLDIIISCRKLIKENAPNSEK